MIADNYKQAIDDSIEKIRNLEDYEVKPAYPEGIISFKLPKSGALQIFDARMWENYGGYQAWVKQLSPQYKIWSVQNGNEVLTVGDTVVSYEKTFSKKIVDFKIDYSKNLTTSLDNGEIHQLPNTLLIKATEEKTYTESDMRKCFEEARLLSGEHLQFINATHLPELKHQTFEEYLTASTTPKS